MASTSTGKEPAKQDAAADDVPTNPRGIPRAPFVDKVEDYVTSRDDVEPTLRRFQEMISKYQFMEQNLQRRVAGLDAKLPDIQKTLDTVRFLEARGPAEKAKKGEDDDELGSDDEDADDDDEGGIETTFELNDTLYAKAKVPPTDEVYLWLGANVMLAYPIAEARDLLQQKLTAAQTSRRNCEEDLEFLREQITTMEVAIARVYNWDVVQKRKEKAEEEGAKTGGSGKEGGEPDG